MRNLIRETNVHDSSRVKKVELFDDDTIVVTFTKGDRYIYESVSKVDYASIVGSKSVGAALNVVGTGKTYRKIL